ncbi:MAG TPA: TSUP family transporter [Polyangiaceae bacterium]|jgi:hypothetical protein
MPFRQPRAEYRSSFDKLLKLPDEALVYPAHDYCVKLMRGLKLANPKLVIAINSAAGFVGHVGDARLDLGLVAALTAAAVAGALAGERMAAYLSVERLRRGFTVFVIAVGLAVVVSSAGANVG